MNTERIAETQGILTNTHPHTLHYIGDPSEVFLLQVCSYAWECDPSDITTVRRLSERYVLELAMYIK